MLPERAHGCPGNLGLSTRHWVASGMRFGFSDLENERHKKKGRGFAGAEKGGKKNSISYLTPYSGQMKSPHY